MALETLADFSPAEILPLIPQRSSRLKIISEDTTVREILVKTCSLRLQVFKRSLICSTCGIAGVVFKLQKQANKDERPHLNLYALKTDEEESLILMTQDHIFPRSKGGKDSLDNLTTMCVDCNLKKGDQII